MNKLKIIITLTLFTSVIFSQVDYSSYQVLLDEYVDSDGLVDYARLQEDKMLDEIISSFEQVEWENLQSDERLAFFINSYNLYAIKNVVDFYPIKSPLDVNNFFKLEKFLLGGELYSLDEIEYNLLFNIDSVMIHFGIVCAALSCPKLLKEVYRGQNVYSLLTKNLKTFLMNSEKNRIDHESEIIYLSQIFNWFKKQFRAEGGSLQNFIMEHAPGVWKGEK